MLGGSWNENSICRCRTRRGPDGHGCRAGAGVAAGFTDEAYRVRVVTRHGNPAVRRYWLDTFDKKDQRFRTEAEELMKNEK